MKNLEDLTVKTNSNPSHPAAFINPFQLPGTLMREA